MSPTELLSRESNAYAWLRRTIALLAEGSNPEEFLEHTKLELFQDQVFCFTPKGKLIALPRKATPIDFAYAVHTDVGNQAIGCKINGKIAPLASELQNGDEVEILTSKAQAAPPAGVGVARRHRQGACRDAPRHPPGGAHPICRTRPAHRRARVPARQARLFRREPDGALPRLARHSIEDVFAAVGRGEMKASDVIRAMYPDYKEERASRGCRARRSRAGSASRGARRSSSRCPGGRSEQGQRHSDPRHQQRSAGALRARRRRRAGRPHRRHHDARGGDHHLSDPVLGLEGLRGHPRPLARRALGRRRRRAAALSGPRRRAVRERARLARSDRPGDRRA